MPRQPFLFCVGCHKRMLLPVPTPEETSIDRPQWPTGTWSATVLHLGCEHLSDYTERDLRGQGQTRTADPNLLGRKHPTVVPEWRRVRLSCAAPKCTAQTTVFVCLTSASTLQQIETKIFALPRVWRCPQGHPAVHGKTQQEEVSSLW